ncbi:uncharacterized protein LOC109704610 [Ananas comosus]|uniref:Uncharacterized protein LOC109704610 n=1 Tax=Ananas comosus TaxID=4615 RepID=A0A6P5EHM1_ANACO|nr:uncharacterized protein LOC109704610 [Ananas comosus]
MPRHRAREGEPFSHHSRDWRGSALRRSHIVRKSSDSRIDSKLSLRSSSSPVLQLGRLFFLSLIGSFKFVIPLRFISMGEDISDIERLPDRIKDLILLPFKRRLWSEFPFGLLVMIAARLDPPDVVAFRSICKRWRLAAPLVHRADVCPLLLDRSEINRNTIKLHSPAVNKTFIVKSFLDLPQSSCRFATKDWLAFVTENGILLANVFKGISYQFHHQTAGDCETLALIGEPAKGFIIVLFYNFVSYMYIEVYDGNKWSSRFYDNNGIFEEQSRTSPVVHRGKVFLFDKKGRLGVYSIKDASWAVLPQPKSLPVPFKPASYDDLLFPDRAQINEEGEDEYISEFFLVVSNDLLLSLVKTGRNPPKLLIFYLTEDTMSWEPVSSLGEYSVFAGFPISISATPSVKKMENRVYFPMWIDHSQEIEAEITVFEEHPYFVSKVLFSDEMEGASVMQYFSVAAQNFNIQVAEAEQNNFRTWINMDGQEVCSNFCTEHEFLFPNLEL